MPSYPGSTSQGGGLNTRSPILFSHLFAKRARWQLIIIFLSLEDAILARANDACFFWEGVGCAAPFSVLFHRYSIDATVAVCPPVPDTDIQKSDACLLNGSARCSRWYSLQSCEQMSIINKSTITFLSVVSHACVIL